MLLPDYRPLFPRFRGSWAPGLSRSHLDSAVELSCSDRNSLRPLGKFVEGRVHRSHPLLKSLVTRRQNFWLGAVRYRAAPILLQTCFPERQRYHSTGLWSFPLGGSTIVEMTSHFLTQLADQLQHGKNPSERRAIQRVLPLVVARFEAGRYPGRLEAESELRSLIEQACLKVLIKPF